MSNFIAAWGPSGPLYLIKTETQNKYYVVNGDWVLDPTDNIPNEYYIIQDNMQPYDNYNSACEYIKSIYKKHYKYHHLYYKHHTPYEKHNNDNIIGSKITNSGFTLNKLKGVTEEQFNELPKLSKLSGHFSTHEIDSDKKITKYKTSNREKRQLEIKMNNTNELEIRAICKHFNLESELNETNLSVIK